MGKNRGPRSKNIGKFKAGESNEFIWVDPQRIRFQHARIRPYFSSCGRALTDTLDSIRRREISPDDLPPIQVLIGPETDSGVWYFSLNNRRLWVLKRCREEGLLKDNLIRVRVRRPKSTSEVARYTVEKCVTEAKIMKEFSAFNKKDIQLSREIEKHSSQSPVDNMGGEVDELSSGGTTDGDDDDDSGAPFLNRKNRAPI